MYFYTTDSVPVNRILVFLCQFAKHQKQQQQALSRMAYAQCYTFIALGSATCCISCCFVATIASMAHSPANCSLPDPRNCLGVFQLWRVDSPHGRWAISVHICVVWSWGKLGFSFSLSFGMTSIHWQLPVCKQPGHTVGTVMTKS